MRPAHQQRGQIRAYATAALTRAPVSGSGGQQQREGPGTEAGPSRVSHAARADLVGSGSRTRREPQAKEKAHGFHHEHPTRSSSRSIPLAQITIQDGFNPRGEVAEDDELHALAETIRTHGCLLPVRVRRDGERFVLIAGERRYRAAHARRAQRDPRQRPPRRQAGDEPAERLTEALIENELRTDLDPLHRAHAYQALLDQGLTIRGIAERLGGTTGRRGREQRIKEHLQILTLPERAARRRWGRGRSRCSPSKRSPQLSEIHPELALAALKAVEPANEYEEPYSWTDVAAAPLQSAARLLRAAARPASTGPGRATRSTASTSQSRRKQDLAVLAEHGHAPEQIRFTGRDGRAGTGARRRPRRRLVAAHRRPGRRRHARRRLARRRPQRRRSSTPPAAPSATAPSTARTRRGRRAAARAGRRRNASRNAHSASEAVTYNLRLGTLAFKHLARVKVDERVLRILAARRRRRQRCAGSPHAAHGCAHPAG